MRRKTLSCSLTIFLTFGVCANAPAEDYRGADAVLKQAAAGAEQAATPAPEFDSPIKLKHDLKSFEESAKSLEPAATAKQWLGFVDRFVNLPADRESMTMFSHQEDDPQSNRIGFQNLVYALPPPPAWDPLSKALAMRPADKKNAVSTPILKAMIHYLLGSRAAFSQDLDQLEQQPRMSSRYVLHQLRWAAIQNSDDGTAILNALTQRLQNDAKTAERGSRLTVPDLVSLVGEEKATAFLRNALRNEPGELDIEHGAATEDLARKLALQMVNELKAAQWKLASSLEATGLYEAMIKRFGDSTDDRYQRAEARTYYLLGLIAQHRTADAATFAAELGSEDRHSIPQEALTAMENAGYTRDVALFLHDLLSKNPDLRFWDTYVQFAAKAGESDAMVALAESSASRPGLNASQRKNVLTALRRAYLAADKIDKGLELLRQEIKAERSDTSTLQPNDFDYISYHDESQDAALALVQVGDVLGHKEWIDEGIRAIREAPVNKNDARERQKRVSRLNSLASHLMTLNRGKEAEELLAEALTIAPDPAKQKYSIPVQPETLSLLLELYSRAGRADDVLMLLTRAPQWNARDLSSIIDKSVSDGRNGNYVGFMVADALLRKGRTADAKKVVDALVDQKSDYDPAYELLVRLEGGNATTRLDQIFARDQFEERPLIWKAKLLLEAGKLEEAEKVARQAIAIDPSDGEQGPNRRMYVYAILADIREKRGDAKEAASLRGAVTAIRHSEEADRFYGAGLIKRAVQMYEKALNHFADAYCIQSRLALRMTELGDLAGAEEHYRRAYELMPDSFGRVESHCFGCEGAFEGRKAQSIAEKVFSELAAKRPDKPQIHYLLGYLRKIERRYAEALPEFRKAVQLDPEYLNAWKELSELSEKMYLPAKERESIQFTVLRLDPVGHHSSFHINDVTDFKKAWTALEETQKIQPKKPETLLPLTASAEEINKREKITSPEPMYSVYISTESSGERRDPGHVFAQHHVMQAVIQTFNYGMGSW